jgi:hypothetical protein
MATYDTKVDVLKRKKVLMSAIPILLDFSTLTSEPQNFQLLQTFGAMVNSFSFL